MRKARAAVLWNVLVAGNCAVVVSLVITPRKLSWCLRTWWQIHADASTVCRVAVHRLARGTRWALCIVLALQHAAIWVSPSTFIQRARRRCTAYVIIIMIRLRQRRILANHGCTARWRAEGPWKPCKGNDLFSSLARSCVWITIITNKREGKDECCGGR